MILKMILFKSALGEVRIFHFFFFFDRISSFQTKKEILIVVNNNVSDDSSIFDGSLYEDANVNVVSLSGIWKLSENYLKPRVFTKLER